MVKKLKKIINNNLKLKINLKKNIEQHQLHLIKNNYNIKVIILQFNCNQMFKIIHILHIQKN